MGLDFDATEYCKNLKVKQESPPFICPVGKCGKSYKSVCGLQYHLVNYDHDNPQPFTPLVTPNRKRGRSRVVSTPKTPVDGKTTPKEAVTFCEAENHVQYDIDGKSIKVSAIDELPIMSEEEYQKMIERGEVAPIPEVPPEPHLKLPEASFKEIENYNICDAPLRPNAYIRFIEKSAEELDGEVEYDVDEEDTTWLSIVNEKREEQGLNPVNIDTLELLMDRLEKESYFQAAANGQNGVEVDDDAVCCICMDGECQNTNVILFCDMCNLAVHQDCYGVPYIPEGQWLCRRCLQSPSTPVNCVLCPNSGGAFKQTDRGLWAHVVCALWIPEVRFANTVFLEPIDSIEMIPPARWRLTCYVCKEKGIGACIQCQRNNCYAAFHVTCAQQAGLYMRMDTVKDSGNESLPVTVQKSAYCHAHTPADAKMEGDNNFALDKAREETRNKMKEARKLLAKKRSSVPVILIPTIPQDRLQEITGLVTIQKKSQFIQRLIAYWTLKRQYRNGVPLLRRLQSQGQSHGGFGRNGIEGCPNTSELYQQLKYWQCLRQDLERARLLCELVRKREKLKVAFIKTCEQVIMLELNPLEAAMNKLLDMLETKDTTEIFLEPVDIEEVPDYTEIVKHPMDLGTMREKLKSGQYSTLDDMESDFDLMIKNCLAYNNKDTIFYRAGIRMRDQGGPIFKLIRKELEKDGIVEQPKTDDCIAQEIDNELGDLLKEPPSDEIAQKIQILIDKAQAMKNPNQRTRRIKQIRIELAKIRKTINKVKTAAKAISESSQSDGETKRETVTQTPPCSPLKSACSSASPSGVNRRTAVLFTRKAQAALKKPELIAKEESSCDTSTMEKVKSPKRNIRHKRLSHHRSIEGEPITEKLHKSPTTSPKKSPNKEIFETIPASFRVYRANTKSDISESDDSDLSDYACSSCSGFSVSGSGSEFDSSFDDGPSGSDSEMMSLSEHDQQSPTTTGTTSQNDLNSEQKEVEKCLEPLKLVWAKCRGYPWYPALIIDPKTPKGFVYNGVALPAPTQDVLNLRKNYTELVYLVLFFDAKRTWQWLPSVKLELLGLNKKLDQSKLIESRKPTERKAVKKAYQDALHYQSQVSDLEGQGPGAIM